MTITLLKVNNITCWQKNVLRKQRNWERRLAAKKMKRKEEKQRRKQNQAGVVEKGSDRTTAHLKFYPVLVPNGNVIGFLGIATSIKCFFCVKCCFVIVLFIYSLAFAAISSYALCLANIP